MSDEATKVNSTKYKCNACGGNMEFDPESQSLKCIFCNDIKTIESSNEKPLVYDFNSADTTASRDWGEQKRVIKCENCGASVNPNTGVCEYCGSRYRIHDENLSTVYK